MHLFPSGECALRQKPPEGRFCNRSKCLPPLTEARLESTNGGPPRSVIVNPAVLEYETLIALNQLKVHCSATVTLALQSIAMSFPAAGHPAMVRAGPPGGKTEHRAGDRRRPRRRRGRGGRQPARFHASGAGPIRKAGLPGVGETDLGRIEFPAMSLKEGFEAFTAAVYGAPLRMQTA